MLASKIIRSPVACCAEIWRKQEGTVAVAVAVDIRQPTQSTTHIDAGMKKLDLEVFLLISVATPYCQAFVLSSSRAPFRRLEPLRLGRMDWSPLTPKDFDDVTLANGYQIAKDQSYLDAVLKQWNSEDEKRSLAVETKIFEYKDDTNGNLFGHVMRRATASQQASQDKSLPGILLFHTGAGPLDVFLFYKAHCLLQTLDCVVTICDFVSDPHGWAWSPDRSQFAAVYNSLIANGGSLLRSRATSAANALCCVAEVDPQRLAAIGWCLGGQPCLELGRVKSAAFSIRAVSTFHGVFHRDEAPSVTVADESPSSSSSACGGRLLICNGKDDPFVSEQDLEDTKNLFEANGWEVELQQYEGAQHGFSNPAQDLNENPSFSYNKDAATKSWDATLQLLEKQLFSKIGIKDTQ